MWRMDDAVDLAGGTCIRVSKAGAGANADGPRLRAALEINQHGV